MDTTQTKNLILKKMTRGLKWENITLKINTSVTLSVKTDVFSSREERHEENLIHLRLKITSCLLFSKCS